MNSDFDRRLDRSGTGSLKWDRYVGRDILPFWVADMDFPCAPAILDALRRRMEHPVFGYTRPYKEVADPVLDYLRAEHAIPAERDWLVFLPGLVPALNTTARAYARRYEEVMICKPVYPPFFTAAVNQKRKTVAVPLVNRDGRFTFDWEAMEHAVTGSTRVFLHCNPHNPVGRVYTREELERLASFCARHDLIIASDEIHCDLVLEEGLRHTSMLALGPVMRDRTALFMSPSKTYNLPGLACAFAVIPNQRLRTRFEAAMRGMLTEVNVFGYAACAAAYRDAGQWHADLITYLRGNRDHLRAFLAQHIPAIKMLPCEATYLAWLDPSELHLDNPVQFFEDAGVGLSNGADYGQPGMLRFNFGCPRSMLDEGLARMVAAVAGLRAGSTTSL